MIKHGLENMHRWYVAHWYDDETDHTFNSETEEGLARKVYELRKKGISATYWVIYLTPEGLLMKGVNV